MANFLDKYRAQAKVSPSSPGPVSSGTNFLDKYRIGASQPAPKKRSIFDTFTKQSPIDIFKRGLATQQPTSPIPTFQRGLQATAPIRGRLTEAISSTGKFAARTAVGAVNTLGEAIKTGVRLQPTAWLNDFLVRQGVISPRMTGGITPTRLLQEKTKQTVESGASLASLWGQSFTDEEKKLAEREPAAKVGAVLSTALDLWFLSGLIRPVTTKRIEHRTGTVERPPNFPKSPEWIAGKDKAGNPTFIRVTPETRPTTGITTPGGEVLKVEQFKVKPSLLDQWMNPKNTKNATVVGENVSYGPQFKLNPEMARGVIRDTAKQFGGQTSGGAAVTNVAALRGPISSSIGRPDLARKLMSIDPKTITSFGDLWTKMVKAVGGAKADPDVIGTIKNHLMTRWHMSLTDQPTVESIIGGPIEVPTKPVAKPALPTAEVADLMKSVQGTAAADKLTGAISATSPAAIEPPKAPVEKPEERKGPTMQLIEKPKEDLQSIADRIAPKIPEGVQDQDTVINNILNREGIKTTTEEFGQLRKMVKDQVGGKVYAREAFQKVEKPVTVAKTPSPTKLPQPKTGAKAIRSRLELEVSKNEISREDARTINQFISMIGDDVLSNVGISIRRAGDTGAAGRTGEIGGQTVIEVFKRVIKQSKTGTIPKVTIHELWHSVTPYLPKDYIKSFEQVFLADKKKWLSTLTPEQKSAFRDIEGRVNAGTEVSKELFSKVPDNFYRYTNLDEWFADTFTDKSLEQIQREYGKQYKSTWDKFIDFLHALARAIKQQFRRAFNGDKAKVEDAFQKFMQSKFDTRRRNSPGIDRFRTSFNLEEKPATPILKDKFGLEYSRAKVPVEDLTRDPKFQPRASETAQATEQSVYEKGYDEGLVTQPMVVVKQGPKYMVLGGNSRVKGLERRIAEGLPVPKNIEANVYDNLTETQMKQVSRAANQQTVEESLLDKAKSISESLAEKQTPQVQKANLKNGYVYEDYARLWKMIQEDPTGNLKPAIEFGKIDERHALNIAQQSRIKELSTNDVLGILQVIEKTGRGLSFERFNRLADVTERAKGQLTAKQRQTSLFGDSGLADTISKMDNEIDDAIRQVAQDVQTLKRMNEISRRHQMPYPEDYVNLLSQKQAEVEHLKKNQYDALLSKWKGAKPSADAEYRDVAIAQKMKETATIDKSNLDAEATLLRKANKAEEDIASQEAAFGRQASEEAMPEVEKILESIQDSDPLAVKQQKVAEAVAKRKELLESRGYRWVNGGWVRTEPQAVTKRPPGPPAEITQENKWNRIRPEEQADSRMTDEEVQAQDALDAAFQAEAGTLAKNMDKDHNLFTKSLDKVKYRFASPHLLFPEVWKEVFLPHHEFFLFTHSAKKAVREVYKKYKIKRNSTSDFRIQRVKDGQATREDLESLTDGEMNAIRELDELTNKWFSMMVGAGKLTEAQRVGFYAPRFSVGAVPTTEKIYRNIKNFMFKGLMKRSELSGIFEKENTSLVDLLDAYISGFGKELYLKEAFAQAETVISQYEGTKQVEAYEYLEYLQQPRHIAQISIMASRAFAVGQLGIRTQIKNWSYGHQQMFSHGGKHYFAMWNMLLRNPNKFREIASGGINPTTGERLTIKEKFLMDVMPEILGTYGTQAEKAGSLINKIQAMMPSSKMVALVEGILRPMAYVTGTLKGQTLGLTGTELENFAWDFVNNTQFNFTFLDLPKQWRGSGSRLVGQYVITRIRAMEQVIGAAARKDYKWLLRWAAAGVLFGTLAQNLWPKRRRVTRAGEEYSAGGIEWAEFIDIFDSRRLWMVKEQGALGMLTAMMSGFMSPTTSLLYHLLGGRTGLDTLFRGSDATPWEIIQHDLEGLVPSRATFMDLTQLLRAMGVWDYEPTTAPMNTILGANDLIAEYEKDGKTAEAERIKRDYPIYVFKSLAKQYDSRLKEMSADLRSAKSKINNNDKLPNNEKKSKISALEKENQRKRMEVIREFNNKLQEEQSKRGIDFSLKDLIGVPTAQAKEYYLMERAGNEARTPEEARAIFNAAASKYLPEYMLKEVAQKTKEAPISSVTDYLKQGYLDRNTQFDHPIDSTPEKYRQTISISAGQYGVPSNILSAILQVESGWLDKNIKNQSGSGTGIAQFTQSAIDELNRLGYKFTREDALDPQKAIPAASFFLSIYNKRFGSWRSAVENYNGTEAKKTYADKVFSLSGS